MVQHEGAKDVGIIRQSWGHAQEMAGTHAKPSVLLPNALTKRVATRSPRPVFSKPC